MLKSSYLFIVSKRLKPVIGLAVQVTLTNFKSLTKTQFHPRILSGFSTKENKGLSTCPSVRLFHTNTVQNAASKKEYEESNARAVMLFSDFEKAKKKDRKTFFELVRVFETNFKNRKGHVDFIRAALKQMEAFGVHEDIEAYKKILDVLPKGVYIANNFLKVDGMFYPHQQFVALELLLQMEDNRVSPDRELADIMTKIFGRKSHPCRKVYRMLYWATKIKNRSPWLLPEKLPKSPYLLGKLAVERITSVDLQTKISVFMTEDVPESIDHTWVVSGQSQKQIELLEKHSPEVPVVVEGGDVVWLRDKYVNYFILKADVNEPRPYVPPGDKDDISNLQSIYFNPNKVVKEEPSVHEQDDGIIYAVCVTGTSSKDSLLSWIRLLQKNSNPILEHVPVLFRFKTIEKFPTPFSEELVCQGKGKS